ncbi:MAG: hypothetical protein KBT03_09770 [Bacteroidales bacterium]|nr:hypothetical protein [Candidatus Scybalousia scybalohippi]
MKLKDFENKIKKIQSYAGKDVDISLETINQDINYFVCKIKTKYGDFKFSADCEKLEPFALEIDDRFNTKSVIDSIKKLLKGK